MMSLSKGPISAPRAEQYFDEHYSVDEGYYTENAKIVGLWTGTMADDLGLTGEVTKEQFSALLKGLAPQSGDTLVAKALGYNVHAAAWDAQFSCPKSVSLQALVGPGADERLIEAHHRAVQRALSEVERYAMARQHGGREAVSSGNIIAAQFTHFAARPSENATHGPDPQLHSHHLILNITRRPDGQIRALYPVEIYRSQRIGSAIYLSELALEVQQLGYQIETTKADGSWEISGYTREQIMEFSSRRQDIERRMAELGWSGPKAAHIVTLATRQEKRDYDEAELKAEWQSRAREMGIDTRMYREQALRRGPIDMGDELDACKALSFSIAHNINREAVIDRRDLETAALRHRMGKVDLAAVRQQIAAEERAQRLILTDIANPLHPQGAYTTAEMLRLEQQNLELVKGPAQAVASPAEVQRWGETKGLSAEQINATKLVLASNNWGSIIEGFAGAAKTTTVGAVREFAEAHGWVVRGFGMTTTSVKALREAGINAQTVASLLANPLPIPHGPELWFTDESSTITDVKANQTLKAARQLGIARFAYVGDTAQHQGIEAGRPVAQFINAGIPVATLQDIRRQQDPQLRQAVITARGDGAAALALLTEQGRVFEVPDISERYARIAADYVEGRENHQKVLVIAPGNDERRALNQEIRKALVEHGRLRKDALEHQILVNREFTPAQIREVGSYQEGDVIFARGDRAQRRQGIKKNSYLTVEAVNRRAQLLTLHTEDGRHLQVCPYKWGDTDQSAAEVFHPEKRTLAVGDRLQFRRPDRKRDIANGEFAVITAISAAVATIRLEGKQPRELTLPFTAMRHVDYGYTVTSFSSQGATVDCVIISDDAMRGARLVNRAQLYTSISRARIDSRVYTNDVEALARSVKRDPKKAIALDAVRQPHQEISQPKRQQSQSIGMGI
jgi:conjugative relaxase-like TrwC/TraI family protein